MDNIRRAPRWKVLLHAIRIFNDHLYNLMRINFDDKTLILTNVHDTELYVVEAETGELLIIYGEDGTPEHLDQWANDGMTYEVGSSYPMYDYN